MLTILFSAAYAQRSTERLEYEPAPYVFFNIQAGGQTTFTNYDQLKLITPTASISVGTFFTPKVGARLHFNGLWNKGGYKPNSTYNFKYMTSDIDILLNLCTIFGKGTYYPFNVSLIGGFGLNYAWDNNDLNNSRFRSPQTWNNNCLVHNMRIGAMLDYNLGKHWSINVEVAGNSLGDILNSKRNNTDDWSLTIQAGLTYKFGFRRKIETTPVVMAAVEEYSNEQATDMATARPSAKPESKEKEVQENPAEVKTDPFQRDIFFVIAKSNIRDTERKKLNEVIEWMKAHPNTVATITGHADAGTGTHAINEHYASQRAKNVAKALTDAGIPTSRLIVKSEGDKVMPYGDNEKSRVVIIIGQEK